MKISFIVLFLAVESKLIHPVGYPKEQSSQDELCQGRPVPRDILFEGGNRKRRIERIQSVGT